MVGSPTECERDGDVHVGHSGGLPTRCWQAAREERGYSGSFCREAYVDAEMLLGFLVLGDCTGQV